MQLAETFTISRESEDEADVVQVEVAHGDVTGLRRGGADRALRRVGASRRSPGSSSVELGDDPFALDEIDDRLAAGRARRARRGRRGAPRPAGQAHRPARLQAARPAARRARRPRGRSGSATPTTWRGARRRSPARGFQRLKLKLGGARRARRRARAGGARRHRPAAAVRRQRVLDARRGARVPAADGARSTASSRCRRATRTARS